LGFKEGSLTVPPPACSGIELGINPVSTIIIENADEEGSATAVFFVPNFDDLLIIYSQTVDIESCRVDEVMENIFIAD